MVVSEREKKNLIRANAFIPNYCKKSDNNSGNYDKKPNFILTLRFTTELCKWIF